MHYVLLCQKLRTVKGGLVVQIIKKNVKNDEFCMIFAILMQIFEPSLIWHQYL